MSKRVTLGGDRLGAGKKMKVDLKNYGRSTQDMGRVFRSSMAPGVLVPFFVEIGLNGDTWEMDLSTLVYTKPTNGPLFGSFKMQIDFFEAEMRLYNRQLHNNKTGIGLKMKNVIFPKIRLRGKNPLLSRGNELNNQQISQSSAMAYLGKRGLGRLTGTQDTEVEVFTNAMPYLMYWEIFKNYYANKQEEIGYVITPAGGETAAEIENIEIINQDGRTWKLNESLGRETIPKGATIRVTGVGLSENNIYYGKAITGGGVIQIQLSDITPGTWEEISVEGGQVAEFRNASEAFVVANHATENQKIWATGTINEILKEGLTLVEFPLSNIDDMREDILSHPNTSPLIIGEKEGEINYLPYSTVTGSVVIDEEGTTKRRNLFEMNGLAVKTYQSDRFNNWLSTEWIDGEGGIAEITAIDVSEGMLYMDALNIAEKLYNTMNLIAVSGGTYEDWQEAVYGEGVIRREEMPMYMGGLSTEIEFDEVVSTADATTTAGNDQPLGTLAGTARWNPEKTKGGRVRIKCGSPSIIMGIASLTPRIDYSQGNEWWTRLETMDDLHKPELDEIGFQELLTDEMAAWDTIVGTEAEIAPIYKSAGKQPAWIHYMTAVNKTYGDFAYANSEMFMTLNRRYEPSGDRGIKDLTTYIDPAKFNYAFAVQERKAQNFWVQIGVDTEPRRKISAKIIPQFRA